MRFSQYFEFDLLPNCSDISISLFLVSWRSFSNEGSFGRLSNDLSRIYKIKYCYLRLEADAMALFAHSLAFPYYPHKNKASPWFLSPSAINYY